jgi:hypothetical protein
MTVSGKLIAFVAYAAIFAIVAQKAWSLWLYEVRGKAYVGTRFSFDVDHFPDYDSAIDALHGIAAGREVPVYYDPRKPERAVLRWSG